MGKMPPAAQLWIGAVVACGAAMLAYGFSSIASIDVLRFSAFLLIGMVAAVFKVRLPGMNSSVSVNLPFILIALSHLSLPEALVIACCSTVAQNVIASPERPQAIQVLFNFANMANAAGAAFLILSKTSPVSSAAGKIAVLAAATAVFYIVNTMPVALILALLQSRGAAKIWYSILLWTFPYYLASAAIACTAVALKGYIGWHTPLVVLPLMYLVYRSYRFYAGRAQHTRVAMAAGTAD